MNSEQRVTRGEAARALQEQYGLEAWRTKRVLEIAQEFGRKAEPCTGGYVLVVYRGSSADWPFTERFAVYDHVKSRPRSIARPGTAEYTSVTNPEPIKEHTTMPPRGRPARAVKAAPEPAVEPDIARYLEKPFTPTMEDYIEWAEDNLGPLEDLPVDRLFVLGSQLYPKFAVSEFNITRREARKAERAAANGAEDEPEEVAPRPRRGKAVSAVPAAAKPVRTRRAAPAAAAAAVEIEEEETEAVPAAPRRRGRKPAAATAPY